MTAWLGEHARIGALLGALTIAWSAILVRAADVAPATAATFRCAYALPVLWLLTRAEDRRYGPRERRTRVLATLAGAFFALDLIFWHQAIRDAGAGLATVLGNLQVLFLPLAAWALLSERPERRVLATMPLMVAGIVLISGTLEHGAYGDNPGRGAIFGVLTALTYAGFLLALRQAGSDIRRLSGNLFDATAAATILCVAIGAAIGDLDLLPSWPAHAWLVILALSSQVLGWLLIGRSLPRLPAALTSIILCVQPVGSMLLAIALFSEAPSALQLGGVAAVIVGLVLATSGGPSRQRAAPRDAS